MKTCTKCGEVKDEDEFNWRVKDVKRHCYCSKCNAEYKRKWREANPDKQRAIVRKRQEETPEKNRENSRRWRTNNPEKHREERRKYAKINPQVYGTARALRKTPLSPSELFCGLSRSQVNAEVRFDYILRDLLTEKTGVQYHVDHIKPLCEGGVHQMWNLAVIPAQANLKKGPMWFSEDHLTDEDIEAADAAILAIS